MLFLAKYRRCFITWAPFLLHSCNPLFQSYWVICFADRHSSISMCVCVCMRACGCVAQSCLTLLWPHYVGVNYVAHQAPLSLKFSRQEYWSGLPFLSLVINHSREELFFKKRYLTALHFRIHPLWSPYYCACSESCCEH